MASSLTRLGTHQAKHLQATASAAAARMCKDARQQISAPTISVEQQQV